LLKEEAPLDGLCPFFTFFLFPSLPSSPFFLCVPLPLFLWFLLVTRAAVGWMFLFVSCYKMDSRLPSIFPLFCVVARLCVFLVLRFPLSCPPSFVRFDFAVEKTDLGVLTDPDLFLSRIPFDRYFFRSEVPPPTQFHFFFSFGLRPTSHRVPFGRIDLDISASPYAD